MSRSRSKALISVAGIAALSLAVGVYAGSRITSPADAAARTAPPEASAVTVPVEKRALSNQVVARGDAKYAGAVKVELELGGVERPVVTGQVPKVGSKISEGDVLLEVVGRPVIALKGELPMYRSLRPAMSGPDVKQLEQTLQRLGFNPGIVDDEYTAATSQAVTRLFNRAGYQPPGPDEQAKEAVKQAANAVNDAKSAAASGDGSARQRLAEATKELQRAQFEAGTPLPSAEVVYLPSLPRSVDEVKVRRGGEVSGAVMSVSGANLVVTVDVSDAEGKLLDKGMAAGIDLPSGDKVKAAVTKVKKAKGGGYLVVVKPAKLTKAQRTELRSANVKVTVPIESSKGKVLAVPLAALSTGPDGKSRVEVSRNGRLQRVGVDVGLVADGYAEVRATDGTLEEGDLVVVGAGK